MALTKQEVDKLESEGYSFEEIVEADRMSSQQPQEAQPTQERIQPQNILGQLMNVPGAAIRSAIQGKGYTAGALNPDQVPKFQDMAMQAAGSIQNPALRGYAELQGSILGAGADIATSPGDILTGLLAGPTSKAVGKTAEVILKNDKLAGNVINSLIKPIHKEYMFGKNPGQAIAKEGLVATNMESLHGKVSGRIEDIKKAISEIRSTPENIYKSVDLTSIRKPLVESLEKLKKTPRTNSQEISGIEDAMADITDLVTKVDKVGLGRLPISDAYNIKEAVSVMQKWNRDTSVGTQLNKALKQVYHEIDSKIDDAIPEVKNLNSRMSNLISARQAIERRVEVLSKQEGMPSLMRLMDLPFAALKTTGSKTMLGKLLARQYSLPK